jgi:tetratricopeptide (TPR) repeat protein
MNAVNWMDALKWSEENLEDLRNGGYAYIRQGKYDIALHFFKALCVLDTESAYNYQTLGALYLELGEANKAIEKLNRALQMKGDHAPTLLNLCKALVLVGKKGEALKLAELLSKEKNAKVANMARALLLAYS